VIQLDFFMAKKFVMLDFHLVVGEIEISLDIIWSVYLMPFLHYLMIGID